MTENRQKRGILSKYLLIIDNSIEEGTIMEHQQKNVFLLFLGIVFL